MPTTVSQEDLQVFIGYFEEPEPGVPDGCTGWYHSGGAFEVRSPEHVFDLAQSRSLLRDNVSGPFTCQEAARLSLSELLAR